MRSTQRFLFLGRRVSPPVVGRRGYAALPVSAAAAAVEKALILKEPLEAVLGGRAEGLIRVLRAEVTLCSELTTALEQRGQLRGNDARIVELFQASAGKAAEDIAFYLEQNPLEEMAKEAAATRLELGWQPCSPADCCACSPACCRRTRWRARCAS